MIVEAPKKRPRAPKGASASRKSRAGVPSPVERARLADAPQISALIQHFADLGQGFLLQRSLAEIYENIRDFFVVREGERVVGCVCLHVNWADLAELKSLAVTEKRQGRGLGAALTRACLAEAKELVIKVVYALTYQVAFFEKLGFSQVEVRELPRKVWGECYRCPKFLQCDEVALIYEVEPLPPGGLREVGGGEFLSVPRLPIRARP